MGVTGADAIVRVLKEAGVDVVFGLCGDTSLPFYDALADQSAKIGNLYLLLALARFRGLQGRLQGGELASQGGDLAVQHVNPLLCRLGEACLFGELRCAFLQTLHEGVPRGA